MKKNPKHEIKLQKSYRNIKNTWKKNVLYNNNIICSCNNNINLSQSECMNFYYFICEYTVFNPHQKFKNLYSTFNFYLQQKIVLFVYNILSNIIAKFLWTLILFKLLLSIDFYYYNIKHFFRDLKSCIFGFYI